MDPIAAHNQPIAARAPGAPVGPLELSALLRDGRVLAGEVLQTMTGGVLLGIGRQRVPAQTNLQLEPGHHFLFQVEHAAEGILLRILGQGGGEESDLLRLLRQVIGEDRPIGELLAEIAARVRSSLAKPGGDPGALRALLDALDGHVFRPGGPGAHGADGAALRDLLGRAGLRYEALLLAAAARGAAPALLTALARDLKGELLRHWLDLPEGALRDAVGRALAGLEAEQLLNLVRRQTGEPQVFGFPLPDGEGWTTAKLLVHPRRDREGGEGQDEDGADSGVHRLVLGVSFSRTGPVRADLVLTDRTLSARLTVTDAAVAERVRRDLRPLAESVSDGRRRVRLSVGLGTREDVEVGARPLDLQVFRDHPLMDVHG